MKKFFSLLIVMAIGLVTFGVLSKKVDANKSLFAVVNDDSLEAAKEISIGIMRNRLASRAAGNVDDFAVKRVEIDDISMAHTHFQQKINGVPVWGGEAIVHLKSDGELAVITDSLKENILVSTDPAFSKETGVQVAVKSFDGREHLTEKPKTDMWIFRGDDRDHLVYRVQLARIDGSDETSAPVYFVDAHNGEVVFQYDNLQTGTGTSLYRGTVSLSTSGSGSSFYMEDNTRKMGTFNMNSTGDETYGTGGTESRFTDTNDIWDTTAQKPAVDAHYGAAKTYDFYKLVLGRNGIDGNGGPLTTSSALGSTNLITSRVHYGTSGRYNNAFWYNNKMSYGDGDGVSFSPLTTLDICGHEMTHGVTEHTANLIYNKESGALNESWSDIMGAMVELYAAGGSPTANTWKLGEDAYTPGTSGDALRYLNDPTINGYPDHYSERVYQGSCTPSNATDQCGVHTNSAISNKAFYLAAAGGTHPQSNVVVTGMGTTAAQKIWYSALAQYMTASTNFAGARTATLNAATAYYGATSAEYNSTAMAWCAVGVGTCPTTSTPTPTPTPTATPTPTPSGSNLWLNGGFEASASPTVGSGTGYFYVANGNYPQAGTGYIYFGVDNSVSGQAYQTISIPSTAQGTLNFYLSVTSNETTTSTQYDKLFVEVRNSSGTLLSTLATYSNLNKTSTGAYSLKTLSLASYKGSTVRVQFRTTTDSSVTTTFRVDTVSVQ